MKIFIRLFIFVCLVLSLPAYAQNPVDPKKDALDRMTSDIEKSSRKLGAAIKVTRENGILDQSVKKLAYEWYDQICLSTKPLKDMGIDLQPHLEYLRDDVARGESCPGFSCQLCPDSDSPGQWCYIYFIDGHEDAKAKFDSSINNKCIDVYNGKCRNVMEKVRDAINTYKAEYIEQSSAKVRKTLELYSDKWGDYFTKARSQTFLELIVNSWYYRDEVTKDSFVPPPAFQFILLHPGILVEYVGGAEDGSRFSQALGLEWFGANWWDLNVWGWNVPIGFSLISTYSDQSEVDNLGHGAMLHINNNYSLGATIRPDGNKGIFLSVDLLKLFEDKQSNFQKYKEAIESGLN